MPTKRKRKTFTIVGHFCADDISDAYFLLSEHFNDLRNGTTSALFEGPYRIEVKTEGERGISSSNTTKKGE